MSGGLHRSELLKELRETFPELVEAINAEMGELGFEVDAFRRFTQQMINDGDREAVASCFAIARKYYVDGNRKVRAAIDAFFVDDLEFSETKKRSRAWAWEAFPAELKTVYENYHGKPV